MSARQSLLFRISNPFALSRYLNGREFDERVTYATFINKGKKYPYANKRQNSRFSIFEKLKARGLIREVTP